MLLESQEPDPKSPESEAFAATVDNYKISLVEISRLSGVTKDQLEKFYKGTTNLTTRTITRVMLSLSPTEAAFYSALVQMQSASRAAKVRVPFLEFREISDITDVYRQAFEYTIQTFKIEIKKLAIRSDIKDTNIAAWKSGRRDFTQDSMDKLKAAFTLEQRTIFLALVEIFFIVGAEKMQRIRPQN